MKKISLILVAALLALTSCTHKDMNILVTYFSATGTTAAAAQSLAEALDADLMAITPAVAYTDADLDWRDSLSRSTLEMRDRTSRPALADAHPDVSRYNVVFIGFPIWWYTAPTIINTFIESADLKGKTVIAFATSGSSSIDGACADLKAAYPDLLWRDGKLLNGVTADDLAAWKAELGF